MFQPLGSLQPTILLLVVLVVLLISSAVVLSVTRMKSDDRRVKTLTPYLTFGHWPTFFARFGLMQFAVCILSMLVAGVAMAVRPTDAVKLAVQEISVSPSDANPSVIDVTGNSVVTIHAIVTEPADGAATLLVGDARHQSAPIRRLRVTSGKWTVWQGEPDAEQLHISAAKPDDVSLKTATSLKILVTTRRGSKNSRL